MPIDEIIENSETSIPLLTSLVGIHKPKSRNTNKKTSLIEMANRIEEDDDSDSEEDKNKNQFYKPQPIFITRTESSNIHAEIIEEEKSSKSNKEAKAKESDFQFEGQVLAMVKKQQGSR